MKEKTVFKKLTNIKPILGLQLITSILLLYLVVRFDFLPIKYFLVLIIVLLLLLGLSFLLIHTKKTSNTRSLIGKIISIILSFLMIIASLYVYRGRNFISNLTGANKQTHVMSVIVLNDSSFDDLSDLQDKAFGNNTTLDNVYLSSMVENIETKLGTIMRYDYDTFAELSDALYNGDIDAIIMDEAYRALCEEQNENFSSDTKVIYSVEFEEELSNITTSVSVTTEPFNIYISGIDTSGPVNTVSRTDVNLIITVNPKTKQIILTSIPRDMYVTFATSGQKDKITHSGIYGINETIQTVENWLGMDINYYVRVNFTSLVNIIDALGGISVYSPVAFTAGNYSFVEGYNQMDGDKSLGFVRERYSLSGGDLDRGKNQMRVLTAIINKIVSPSIITNYSSILSAVEGSFETNMETSDITSLIKMQLNNMSDWNIQTQQITGEGHMDLPSYAMGLSSGVYVMVPYEDSVNQAITNINKVLNGETVTVDE